MTTEAEPDSKKVGEEAEEGEEQMPLSWYYKPGNMYVIIEKEWVLFTLVTAFIYCIHLVWMCYGVDVYASYERHNICTGTTTKEEASGVYDTWILCCIIFHMVEWIRQTIYATSALVGVNLVGVYYALKIMAPFGIIVMLAGSISAFTSDSDCQEKQSARATYLKLQLLGCIVTIMTFMLPLLIFKIKGAEWCHAVYIREDDEDEEEDGEKKDEE